MARLYLNTEITAMPDSDKPRPRALPPAPNGNFTGIYSKIFNFYTSLGNFGVVSSLITAESKKRSPLFRLL